MVIISRDLNVFCDYFGTNIAIFSESVKVRFILFLNLVPKNNFNEFSTANLKCRKKNHHIMTIPVKVSKEEWLKARIELLKKEKEHSKSRDELTYARQEMPWVKVEKD